MEPGKIVFTGKTKKHKDVVIRYPKKSDAQIMCDYINTLSDERTFIRFQGEHMSLEDEKRYLASVLDKMSKNEEVHLLAFINDELIGTADVDKQDRTDRHVGELGMSVAKDYRGEGIGALLMQLTIDEAAKYFEGLEMVTLCVFASNHVAIQMYQSFGFIEYGRLPHGIKLEDGYDDLILMYKILRKIS